MKQQIFVIHGGTSFNSNEEYLDFIATRELTLETLAKTVDWRFSLSEELGDEFEVLLAKMPNPTNSRYSEWSMWFTRCMALLTDDAILIGHSLGGIFLAKYLSEETISKRIKATILVAAPYDKTSTVESLRDFALPQSLTNMEQQAGAIYLLQSTDDPIVPIEEMEKYQQRLPHANKMIFEGKGHCGQPTFPELTELLRSL